MRLSKRQIAVLAGTVATALAAAAAALAGLAAKGPSSSHAPYVVPVHPSVSTFSLLTVGDNVPGSDNDAQPGYQMVGIPDGLGAFDNGDGTYTLLMNHELRSTQGIVRDHGAIGSFVSKWKISKSTGQVLAGEDLIKQVSLAPGGVYSAPAKGVVLSRLCSADLPAQTALYNSRTGRGYDGRLYLNGEEAAPEGRAFAHALDGTSYELPALGKMSWENAVANPGTRDKTVVVLMDDNAAAGQVYVYVGNKQSSGNPAQRAGLTGGTFYGLRIPGLAQETDATFPPSGTKFELASFGEVTNKTGAQIETESTALGVTRWQRPEDGAWDPQSARDYYWVTTADNTNRSRLWRLRFFNPARPELGGHIDLLLDGTEGPEMMDNMTVDEFGRVLIDEDPGGDPTPARIWSYDIGSGALTQLTEQKQVVTGETPPPGTNYTGYVTDDEEVSGIIPLTDVLGPGWYLTDSQIHQAFTAAEADAATAAKLVEKGQVTAIYYPVGDE
jgi:Bacterial protein of unknown function (DUF839)